MNHRVAGSEQALERLERSARKRARSVLRGVGSSNVASLLDFCFVERQKRLSVGDRDYYVDLLFYNRYLWRMVAIELKTKHFKPSHKGQMEFYLRWLDKYEKRGDDKPPIGIILCSEKGQQEVELFDLDESGSTLLNIGQNCHPKNYWKLKFKKLLNKSPS